MKKLFESALLLSMSLLWILNFSSGIIATIWLILSGGWSFVLLGFVIGIVMPWVYSLAALPSILIALPLIKLAEKGKTTLVTILGFFLSLYNNFIFAIWVSFVFGLMIQTDYHPLALWLWGYATVMGPIGYMAYKEGKDGGTGTTMGVLFCQISYILLSFGYFILRSETTGYGLVWLLLILFSAFTSFILHESSKESERTTTLNDVDTFISEETIQPPSTVSSKNNNYCTNCGEKIQKESNFCTNCGTSLKG